VADLWALSTGLKGTHGIALNPDGKTGYISDGAGNAVVVFDRSSLTVKANRAGWHQSGRDYL
jgi:DNA-binding beta-propeller fold protein YncE